jgi:hypothetical protein
MQKKLLIGLVAVIVIGAGGFFLFNSSDSEQIVEKEIDSFTGTFADVFAVEEPVSCTAVTVFDTGGESQGTLYYIDERNFVLDSMILLSDNDPIEAHIIRDGDYEYTWSPKFLEEEGVGGTKRRIDPSYEVNEEIFAMYDDGTEYQCESWTVDNAMFIPPSDIEFEDITR